MTIVWWIFKTGYRLKDLTGHSGSHERARRLAKMSTGAG